MVLRDNHIFNLLCSISLLLVVLFSACQHSDSSISSSTDTSRTSEKEKVTTPTNNPVSVQAQSLRIETQKTLGDMNGVFRDAESQRSKKMQEKGADTSEEVNAVYEKSGSVLGALFILQGSIDAVEKHFLEGFLDENQAQEMLNKLRRDMQSYQKDVAIYKDILKVSAPTSSEKK